MREELDFSTEASFRRLDGQKGSRRNGNSFNLDKAVERGEFDKKDEELERNLPGKKRRRQ